MSEVKPTPDRELLELAAKAAGYDVHDWMPGAGMAINDARFINGISRWNPLTDDGDALRLAVKLRMEIRVNGYGAAVRIGGDGAQWFSCEAHMHSGIEAGTRRAIVRAAASLTNPQGSRG